MCFCQYLLDICIFCDQQLAGRRSHEQFETGLCHLLQVKQRVGGKLRTEDMLEQARQWDEMRACLEEGPILKL